MLKKGFVLLVILCSVMSRSFAGSFYFAPTITYHDQHTDTLDYRGINPALYLGYGDWLRDYLFVAGEIFYGIKPYQINHDKNNQDTELKMGDSYGLAILPTIALDNSLMGYARFGYVRTDFVNSRTGAFQLGIGLEMLICDSWSARAEYDYIPYRSVEGFGTIKSHDFSLGIVYRMESLFNGPTL